MSSALAIAGVTHVLMDLINNGIIDQDLTSTLGNVDVTSLAPNRMETGKSEKTSINLFMYQATPNPGWRNAGLPSRDADGERTTNPPLALDLHYVLSAYGAQSFHGDILLGYAMQLLHETPVLSRQMIRRSLRAPLTLTPPVTALPASLQSLGTTELAEQVEQIKITPQPLTTEEVSRLWAAFQSPYRATAAYQVSVVLIQSKRPTRSALPVRARNVYALPFRRPVIAQVSPQTVVSGGTLTIAGVNLAADPVIVRLGGVPVSPTDVGDLKLTIVVPASLPAGVSTAQVVHDLSIGTPAAAHRGFESNVAAFLLAPKIISITPPALTAGATVTLGVSPVVGRAQQAVLFVGDRGIARSTPAATDPATTASIDFTIPADVATGTYLLRLEIDGVQSPLDVDTAGTQYTGPVIQVTP